MATAGDILSGAYNRSSVNDPGKLALDPELIAHLDRVFQRLWALLSRARPDEMGALSALLLAGAPPTVALPVGTVDITNLRNAAGNQVHLIPSSELFRTWHMAPSVYRLGLALISRNKAGDPIAGDTLSAIILAAAPPIVGIGTVIDDRFPVRHHQLLVDVLALYLSTKDSGRNEGDRAALVGELRASASAFIAEYNLPPSAIEWIHAPVEHQEVAK